MGWQAAEAQIDDRLRRVLQSAERAPFLPGSLIESLVPLAGTYQHDDLEARTENLDDDPHDVPNGHAHCRQALLGSASQAIPIVQGELQLGRWQRVFFLELDRARDRRVLIQVMGD